MANFFESFLASYHPAAQAETQRRFAREQADKEAEQNKVRNRLAMLQAVGGLVANQSMSKEQGNALLAALDPEGFATRKTAAVASPSVPTAQSAQPIGFGQSTQQKPTNRERMLSQLQSLPSEEQLHYADVAGKVLGNMPESLGITPSLEETYKSYLSHLTPETREKLGLREPTNIGLQVSNMPKTSGVGMKVSQEPIKAPSIATSLIVPKTVSGTVPRSVFQDKPTKPDAPPSLSAVGTFITSSFKSGLASKDIAQALKDKAGINIDPAAVDKIRSTNETLTELKRKQLEGLTILNQERVKLTQAQTERAKRPSTTDAKSSQTQLVKLGEFFTRQKNDLLKIKTKAEENLKDMRSALGFADESSKAILEQNIADAQAELDDFDIRLSEIEQQIEEANQLVGQAMEVEGEKLPPSTKKSGLKKVPGFSQ